MDKQNSADVNIAEGLVKIDKNFSFKNLFAMPEVENKIINKYITEHEHELILPILKGKNHNKDKYYNFIGPMNSGKTFGMIDICNRNSIKAIVAVPLRMIAKQHEKNYQTACKENHSRCKVKAIYGGIKLSSGKIKGGTNKNIESLVSTNKIDVFISTYDSLEKFYELGKNTFNPSQYVLIVDEAHNLVTSYGFRYEALQLLAEYQSSFKKVIYITGTHEGVLLKKYKTYMFNKNETKQKHNVTVVPYDGDGYLKLINLLHHSDSKTTKVILHDNIDNLERFANLLIGTGAPDNSVRILSANNTENDDYASIVENGKIPKRLKFLLTTRLIGDGVNIHSKVGDIYIKRKRLLVKKTIYREIQKSVPKRI